MFIFRESNIVYSLRGGKLFFETIYLGSPMKTSGSPLTMSGSSVRQRLGFPVGRGLRQHSGDDAFFLHSFHSLPSILFNIIKIFLFVSFHTVFTPLNPFMPLNIPFAFNFMHFNPIPVTTLNTLLSLYILISYLFSFHFTPLTIILISFLFVPKYFTVAHFLLILFHPNFSLFFLFKNLFCIVSSSTQPPHSNPHLRFGGN